MRFFVDQHLNIVRIIFLYIVKNGHNMWYLSKLSLYLKLKRAWFFYGPSNLMLSKVKPLLKRKTYTFVNGEFSQQPIAMLRIVGCAAYSRRIWQSHFRIKFLWTNVSSDTRSSWEWAFLQSNYDLRSKTSEFWSIVQPYKEAKTYFWNKFPWIYVRFFRSHYRGRESLPSNFDFKIGTRGFWLTEELNKLA